MIRIWIYMISTPPVTGYVSTKWYCAGYLPPHVAYPTYTAEEFPFFAHDPNEDKQFRLAALEMWVEHHLGSWIALHEQATNTCGKLRQFMESYFSIAINFLEGTPITLSIMYLTLVELWVACDKLACNKYSMLRDYNHEVLLEGFQCLVLPLKTQVARLSEIEKYIDLSWFRSSKVLRHCLLQSV
jgi:hypothetical protein